MRKHVANLGAFLAIIGALSIILYFFNMNLRILRAIDVQGPAVGWAIRIGLMVIGVALFFFATPKSAVQAESEAARRDYFQHPQVASVLEEIARARKISTTPSSDPQTYRVRHVVAEDAARNVVHASDPKTATIKVFLERGEQRLAMMKQVGGAAPAEMALDEATWNKYVG